MDVTASFAREAYALVTDGHPAEAVERCAAGIQRFPDYSTGYIVMAAAYAAAGLRADEAVMLREVKRRFGKDIAPRLDHDDPAIEEPIQAEAQVAIAESAPAAEVVRPERGYFSPLQIIDTSRLTEDPRIIRSSSVRLIPGLEYTSLRFEGMKARGIRVIQQLLDPPTFRDFHIPTRRAPQRTVSAPTAEQPRKRPLSLEELAIRLEKIRMPRQIDAADMAPDVPVAVPPSQPLAPPPVVTETLAKIYATQGKIELAIESYRILQQRMPDRAAAFEATINELRTKL